MLIRRREFIALVSGSPALATLRERGAKVETVFKTPGPKPNGLQATDEGLWILDQGDNHVYLVTYDSGKVLRDLATDTKSGSSRSLIHPGPASLPGLPLAGAPWLRRRSQPSRPVPRSKGTRREPTAWNGATESFGFPCLRRR